MFGQHNRTSAPIMSTWEKSDVDPTLLDTTGGWMPTAATRATAQEVYQTIDQGVETSSTADMLGLVEQRDVMHQSSMSMPTHADWSQLSGIDPRADAYSETTMFDMDDVQTSQPFMPGSLSSPGTGPGTATSSPLAFHSPVFGVHQRLHLDTEPVGDQQHAYGGIMDTPLTPSSANFCRTPFSSEPRRPFAWPAVFDGSPSPLSHSQPRMNLPLPTSVPQGWQLNDIKLWSQGPYNPEATFEEDISPSPTLLAPPALEKTVSNSSSFSCPMCDKAYTRRSDLAHHRRYHGPKKFSCGQCPQAFHFPKDLLRHELIHSADHRVLFCDVTDCKYATKGFHRRDHLNRHRNSKHPDVSGGVSRSASTRSAPELS